MPASSDKNLPAIISDPADAVDERHFGVMGNEPRTSLEDAYRNFMERWIKGLDLVSAKDFETLSQGLCLLATYLQEVSRHGIL